MRQTRVAMLVINAFSHDTRVRKEAKALHQAGYGVRVFALHGERLPKKEVVDGYQVERIQVRSRGWGIWLIIRLIKYLEFSIRAVYHIMRFQPSVIHAHDVSALIPAYVASRLRGAPLIYDAHELWAERHSRLLGNRWLRLLVVRIERALARRADRIVTVNASLSNYLAKEYRVQAPVVLMHSQEYVAVQQSDILREEFGIPRSLRIVVYAGAFLPGRGLEVLIEAAPYLDRSVIVLMGPNHMDEELSRLIQERGLQERVFLRKPVPPQEVNRYVASADVGVVPTQKVDLSYYYGLGNKVFHYLMAGIPVAMSDHPEKRHIVKTYGVGTVFDETNPRDIAEQINGLLADEVRYREMCGQAREISRDVFNWQIESRKLLEMYDEVLQAERRQDE